MSILISFRFCHFHNFTVETALFVISFSLLGIQIFRIWLNWRIGFTLLGFFLSLGFKWGLWAFWRGATALRIIKFALLFNELWCLIACAWLYSTIATYCPLMNCFQIRYGKIIFAWSFLLLKLCLLNKDFFQVFNNSVHIHLKF